MKAKYQDLKFGSEKIFNDWLNKTATKKITFQDDGQDFLTWWVDNRGEVLHCEPFQAWLWNGKMVDLERTRVGSRLKFQDGNEMKHTVKEIKDLTPKEK